MTRRGDVVRLSSHSGTITDITHRDSDAGMWVVRRWKKFLWMERTISSDWFNDEKQALAFARDVEVNRSVDPGPVGPGA